MEGMMNVMMSAAREYDLCACPMLTHYYTGRCDSPAMAEAEARRILAATERGRAVIHTPRLGVVDCGGRRVDLAGALAESLAAFVAADDVAEYLRAQA